MTSAVVRYSSGSLVAVAILVLAAAAPASAQEAPPPVREIDTQVLVDDDGLIEYGGCVEGECAPSGARGYDLLALDAREAYLEGTGPTLDHQPAVVFRITYGNAGFNDMTERSIRLTYSIAGQVQTVDVGNFDNGTPTLLGADAVRGPEVVDTSGIFAIDIWITYVRLGLRENGTLEDIRVRGISADGSDDDMPGTWYYEGQPVPHIPHDPNDPGEAVQEPEPGTYFMRGAGRLMMAEVPQVLVMQDRFEFNVTSVVSSIDQNVTLRAHARDGSPIQVQPSRFDLRAMQNVPIVLTGNATGKVDVIGISDLGGYFGFTVESIQPQATENETVTDEERADKGSPAVGPMVFGLTLLLAAAASRPRSKR